MSDEAKKILIVRSTGFPQEWINETRARFPAVSFFVADDNAASIKANCPGVNVIINCPRQIFGSDILRTAGSALEWMHCGGAGIEEFMVDEFVTSHIVFTNGRIIQGPEVADHALALILAISRNIGRFLKNQPRQDMPRAIELRKKTCLVFGLGGIGLLVAERVKAFGMYVIGIANDYPPMSSFVDEFYAPASFMEQLPRADVVVCSAPNTHLTNRLIGPQHFAAMKDDAIFVNVSRGPIVQTDALVEALRGGKFRGVGLDVTDPEPLPKDHPLWAFDNVLITPHMAGPSDHNRKRSLDLIQTNIGRYLSGEKLFNVVDKAHQY